MIKALIITQNEPFFIPKMIEYILRSQNEKYMIAEICLLKPHRKNKNYFHWFRERAGIYNMSELLLTFSVYLYCMFISLVKRYSPYSVSQISRKFNVRITGTNDINSDLFIEKVKQLKPDIIVSISCPQIFGDQLLVSAPFCINAHGTLLPSHRGVFGSWWTLFSEDKHGGSTIHTMVHKLDAGKILWQKEFVICDDSQYSVAYKTKRDMATGLVEILNRYGKDELNPLTNNYLSSYHRAPSKEQGKLFHCKGLKIIRLKDLKLLISSQFE